MNPLQLFEPFCGAGGMGTGFSRYFKVTHAVDLKPEAVATYKANYRDTDVQLRDVKNISGSGGDFDGVIGVIGGPPCQPWSRLNSRRRHDDERKELCHEFMRLVSEIKPGFFVLENVPYVPREIKLSCENIGIQSGYRCRMEYLNASDYGAAQTRKRWILVGIKGHTWQTPPIQAAKTVRTAFTELGARNWGLMHSKEDTVNKFKNIEKPEEWVALSKGGFKNTIRLAWDSPAPAVVNIKKVYMLHPQEQRNISLAEAAALQGLPPNYIWHGSEIAVAQMIANAMPVELARAIASTIAPILRSQS